MKNKFLLMLTLITFVFCVYGVGSSFASEKTIEIEGKTYLDLDISGEKIKNDDYVTSHLQINDSTIDSNLSVTGAVYDSNSKPTSFNLKGSLTKAEYPGKLIGQLEDQMGNYTVIYFGIEKKSNDSITFLENSNNNNPAIKLYLLNNTTRDFSIFETSDLSSFNINMNDLFDQSDNIPLTEHIDEFWYSKILKPASFKTTEPIVSKSVVSGKSDITHTVSYNIGGFIIYEDITMRALIEGPTALDNSGGTFTTKFYILSQKTRSTDYPSANSLKTNFKIGAMAPTQIEAYTQPGDYFRFIQWDGQYVNGGAIKVDISASYTLPGTPISFATSYTSSQTVNSHSMKTFDNSGSNKAKKVGVTFASGKKLENTGNTFDAVFAVGHFNTPAQKLLTVRWSYDVFNAQDIYAFAPQAKTMTFSYSSK